MNLLYQTAVATQNHFQLKKSKCFWIILIFKSLNCDLNFIFCNTVVLLIMKLHLWFSNSLQCNKVFSPKVLINLKHHIKIFVYDRILIKILLIILHTVFSFTNCIYLVLLALHPLHLPKCLVIPCAHQYFPFLWPFYTPSHTFICAVHLFLCDPKSIGAVHVWST